MSERKLTHLRGRGLDQLLIAVTERRAPQPGHALDVRFAFGVVDVDALPALDDQRTAVAKAREVNIGMHQRFDVAGRKIAERSHTGPFMILRNSRESPFGRARCRQLNPGAYQTAI